MLKILRQQDYPNDESAMSATGKKYLLNVYAAFKGLSSDSVLSKDLWFKRVVKEIDEAEVISCMALDPYTGNGHSFGKVSTGVKMLWLMYRYPDRFLYPSQWLGENCFQAAVDIGVNKDVIVFDDSCMLTRESDGICLDNCRGQIQDFNRGTIYTLVPGSYICLGFELLED